MLPASAGSMWLSSRPKRDNAPLPRTVWLNPLLLGPAICSLPETRPLAGPSRPVFEDCPARSSRYQLWLVLQCTG